MTFHSFETKIAIDPAADLRAWAGAYLNALQAVGLVRVPFVGEIDLATIEMPAVNTTPVGGAVFYLNDSMHATAPIYIKIEFGRGGGVGAAASWLTVGRNVDAAGNIGGVLFPRRQIGFVHSATQGTLEAAATAGDGYVGLFPGATAAFNLTHYFAIERHHDLQGRPTGEGLMVLVNTNTSPPGATFLSGLTYAPEVWAINYVTAAYVQGVPPVSLPYNVNGVTLSLSASLAQGGIGPVFPWVLMAPGLAPWQVINFLTVPAGDLPGGVFETALGGALRNYRPLTPASSRKCGFAVEPAQSTSTGRGDSALCVRWEPAPVVPS